MARELLILKLYLNVTFTSSLNVQSPVDNNNNNNDDDDDDDDERISRVPFHLKHALLR